MRAILAIFVLLIVLAVGAVALAFSPFGNDLLRPYVERVASEKSGMKIELINFIVGFKSGAIQARINDAVVANMAANYDIFKQDFSAKFEASSGDLASFGVDFKEPILISGTASGNIKDFALSADGDLAAGTIKLDGQIVDFMPIKLHLIATKLPLATLSIAALKKPYMVGHADISANIGDENGELASGTAKISMKNAVLNSELIKGDFGLDLGEKFVLSSDAEARISGTKIDAKAVLALPFGTISSKNLLFEIVKNRFTADIEAQITDLSKLMPAQKLSGSLRADTKIELNGGKIAANSKINIAGGVLTASLNDDKLTAKLAAIKASELFNMLAQKPLISGDIAGEIALDGILANKPSGKAQISLDGGLIDARNMSELSGLSFPANQKISAEFSSDILDGGVEFSSNIKTDLLNISNIKGKYNINDNLLMAKYASNIADLSKLAFATKRPLNGHLDINGDLLFNAGELSATAVATEFLDGRLNGELKDGALSLNIDDFDIKEALKMAGWQPFYEGKSSIKANYDLSLSRGDFTLDLHGGKLAQSALTQAVLILLKKDIAGEVYKDGTIAGDIVDGVISFKAALSSPKSNIAIKDGKVDLNTNIISVPIISNFENTDININIAGTTDEPKYEIKSSYLDSKIQKQIDKGLDKLFDGDEKKAGEVKNVLKGLQKLF